MLLIHVMDFNRVKYKYLNLVLQYFIQYTNMYMLVY